MNFNELQKLFISLSNTDEVEESTLALWFNEAQLDLALDFGEVKAYQHSNTSPSSAVVTSPQEAGAGGEDNATASTQIEATTALPGDLLRILYVQDSMGQPIDWEITAQGLLCVKDASEYTLYYRAMPSVSFSGLAENEESALPTAVHHLLAYYAVWKFWDMESEGDTEESNHGTKFLNYYRNGKADMLAKLDFAGSTGNLLRTWTII